MQPGVTSREFYWTNWRAWGDAKLVAEGHVPVRPYVDQAMKLPFKVSTTTSNFMIGVTAAASAGVYLNRLKKRMRLEADPTVQFVIPNGPRRLLFTDLRYDSPYNTYLYYGLPPGPINSPGRKSILAVLYPEKHSYLYFVADGTGGHIFTRNYIEHQKAVKAYRQMRREAMRNQNPPG